MDYIRLRGTGVSPGISIGEVLLTERVIFSAREELIPPDKVDAEKARLQAAIKRTHSQLARLKEKGVTEVFTPGTPFSEVVSFIESVAGTRPI